MISMGHHVTIEIEPNLPVVGNGDRGPELVKRAAAVFGIHTIEVFHGIENRKRVLRIKGYPPVDDTTWVGNISALFNELAEQQKRRGAQ